MSRGKHKAAKAVRDRAATAEAIVAAREELQAERDRLAETQRRADRSEELRTQLAAAVAARDAACVATVQRMQEDRDRIGAANDALAAAAHDIDRDWEKIGEWGFSEYGAEKFLEILSGEQGNVVTTGVRARDSLSSTAMEAIQRARGLRRDPPIRLTAHQKQTMAQLISEITHVPLPDEYQDGEKNWKEFVDVAFGKDLAIQIGAMNPMPWINTDEDPGHPVAAALGACTTSDNDSDSPRGSAAVLPPLKELSAGTAAQRNMVVAAGSGAAAAAYSKDLQHGLDAAAQSQIPDPIANPASYPAPVDAAALASLYTAAAFGLWGRERTEQSGRIAVASAAAVPFWLPPGHTHAYLDSDPLSDSDIGDIRLPFPQVLLTFAEPLLIPAAATGDTDPRLQWMGHILDIGLSSVDGMELRRLLGAGTNNFTQPRMSLWDAIASRGALIEGILLLADARGNLEDRFAWCLAIPSPSVRGVLGRWTVPARRSATSYHDYVLNAGAVAAWADWHRAGITTPADEAGTIESHQPNIAPSDDAVHVLNVSATTPERPNSSAATGSGRSVAPHRRRGHWRRQHFGPGRQEVRRVRIAPVLVNAGKIGDDRPQIYRLPSP